MAAFSGQGFLLCWYSVLRQPVLKPNSELTRPEKSLHVNDDKVLFVSQQSRKHVASWLFGYGKWMSAFL